MLSFLSYIMYMLVLFLRMKRFIDRSIGAYFFGPPCSLHADRVKEKDSDTDNDTDNDVNVLCRSAIMSRD